MFEELKALKDSGFPQPTPKVGQVWVTPDNDTILVISARAHKFACISDGEIRYDCLITNEVYRPTIEELMEDMAVRFQKNWITVRCIEPGKFMCDDIATKLNDVTFGGTAIEAAIKYWNKLNTPKSTCTF